MIKKFIIYSSIMIMGACESRAVYFQDFSVAPSTVDSSSYIVFGSDSSVLSFDDFAYSSATFNYIYNSESENLSLGIPSSPNTSRSRAVIVAVDTSSVTAGEYTFSFDVSNYSQGLSLDNFTQYGLYEGSGIGFESNGGRMSFSVIENNNAGNVPSVINPLYGSSINQIGTDVAFASNGTISQNFSLTEAGSTGDFILLAWTFVSQVGDQTVGPSFDLDNVQVASIPEPSVASLLTVVFVAIFGVRRILSM